MLVDHARSGRVSYGLVSFDEETEASSRRELVQRIISAVCLAHKIHRSYLLQKRKGKSEGKRTEARATLAMLLHDLIPLDDQRTKTMVACTTMMSFDALNYCLKTGRYRCGVDKAYRAKVNAIVQSLL